MRVVPVRRHVGLASGSASDADIHDGRGQASVTVVGDRCLGDAEKTLLEQARRLAAIAEDWTSWPCQFLP